MTSRKSKQQGSLPQVVLLGTGTPGPDPERSGPATAVIVNDKPYLVDFGPGVVRRAVAAYQKGVTAFGAGAVRLRTIFLTHLHADHTAGYPDLIFTPWIMGRKEPLEVYGPKGIRTMTKHVLKAWELDVSNRIEGLDNLPPTGCKVITHEIGPGPIYKDQHLKVIAFPVCHGTVKNAFGFRFETSTKTIVISGDTSPAQTVEDNCRGCDVLVHEAYSEHTFEQVSPKWQAYRRRYHTSSRELAEMASRVRPKLLVLYHRSNPGGGLALANPEGVLLDEIRRCYDGPVAIGHDLDIF